MAAGRCGWSAARPPAGDLDVPGGGPLAESGCFGPREKRETRVFEVPSAPVWEYRSGSAFTPARGL